MPSASNWPLLTFLAVATAGLLRRRGAGEVTRVVATRVTTVDEFLAVAPTPGIVFSHAIIGCSDREIADRFGLRIDDLLIAYGELLIKARAQRAINLRRAQTELATGVATGGGTPAGNGPMLLMLGRNELGQSTNPPMLGLPEPAFELDSP